MIVFVIFLIVISIIGSKHFADQVRQDIKQKELIEKVSKWKTLTQDEKFNFICKYRNWIIYKMENGYYQIQDGKQTILVFELDNNYYLEKAEYELLEKYYELTKVKAYPKD